MTNQPIFVFDDCYENSSYLRPSIMRKRPFLLKFSVLVGVLALAGCAVGPAYQPPTVDAPVAWKESPTAPGWVPFAAPADTLVRSDWWTLFGDDTLNQLADQVQVSNQNIAAAVATTAQARALVNERNAALFPSLSLGAGAQRVGGEGRGGSSTSLNAALGASWEPDLWGRLGQLGGSAQASAQASAADLAAAHLSALGTLASSYVQLRAADAEGLLLQSTVQGFERSLQIARNRYAAGIAANTDVLQAQTQLANTRADLAGVLADRAKLEHAIAVLTGNTPAAFTLPPLSGAAWVPTVPMVPVGVPSTLLQRRPDIVAAERDVAVANAQIGIQRSAYFPSVTLSASLGSSGSVVSDLLRSSNSLWSLGLSLAQVVFDAGAIAARVEGAQAGVEAAVARYRQTVLAAFQAVEDQLTQARTLVAQEALRREASAAADQAEQQMLNRYRAGQVGYTEVVTAQASALNARRALLQLQVSRQVAAVGLVQALGGGWQVDTQPAAAKPTVAP